MSKNNANIKYVHMYSLNFTHKRIKNKTSKLRRFNTHLYCSISGVDDISNGFFNKKLLYIHTNNNITTPSTIN